MRILKALWNLCVVKKSGCGRAYLTKEKISSGVQNAWDEVAMTELNRSLPPLKKGTRLIDLLRKPLMLSLVSLLFSSCGTPVRPDPAPPFSDGNYRSAEFELCGKYFFGVGGCHFKLDSSANVPLKIQGFATGEISIFSDLCRVEWKQRYQENQLVSVPLAALMNSPLLKRHHSCTLKLVVSPDPIKGSEEAIFPRVGEVYIEVAPRLAEQPGLPIADQIRESESSTDGLTLRVTGSGSYLWTQCGSNLQGNFQDTLELPVSRKVSCKYQLAIKMDSGKQYSGVFLRNVFKKDVILLARPAITREPGKICAESDPTVTTFLAINEEWTRKPKLCVKGNGPFKVRVFTAKRNSLEIVR